MIPIKEIFQLSKMTLTQRFNALVFVCICALAIVIMHFYLKVIPDLVAKHELREANISEKLDECNERYIEALEGYEKKYLDMVDEYKHIKKEVDENIR